MNGVNNDKINLNQIVLDTIMSNKIIILGYILFFCGLGFEQLIFPKYFGDFIDSISPTSNFSVKQMALLFSPYVIAQILFTIFNKIEATNVPKIEFGIVNQLVSQIFNISSEKDQGINQPTLMNNMYKVLEFKNIVHLLTSSFIPAFLITVVMIIYLLSIDVMSGLILLLVVITIFSIFYFLGKKCLHESRLRDENNNGYLDELDDLFLNLNSVLTSNSMDYELNRINKKKDQVVDEYIKSEQTSADVKTAVSWLSIVIFLALNFLILRLFFNGTITKGHVISLFFISLILFQYYDNVSYDLKKLMYYIGNYQQLNSYFGKFQKESKKYTNFKNFQKGAITFKNVSVNYGNRSILKNLNLKLNSGEKVSLVGRIGSGKTTLLKLVQNLIPYTGQVLIDGVDIKQYHPSILRKQISYVPQIPKLFNRTIYENLTYGNNYTVARLNCLMKQYNLDTFFKRFEKGLNTVVGKNGELVSGGQRQIIYILRTIMQNKKIILMDEPTTSLDAYHKELFFNILKTLKDRTVIIVTHDPDVLNVTNRTLDMNKLKGENLASK